jgi:Asp-tRNA(Asn)/Glu-tRNA(Gln) amidotransferase C subunit
MVTQRVPSTSGSDCSELVACLTADAVALAVGTAVVFLVLVATVAHVRSARRITDEERQRVRSEAEALAAFASEVSELEPRPAPGGRETAGATTMVETVSSGSLEEVADAYRGTVMDVPHYEAEYGETLARNMAQEFGDDVAGAVVAGRALTPQLKETLLKRSGRAHRLRLALLEHLEAESEELADLAETFERIVNSVERIEDEDLDDASFEALVGEWYLLEDREQESQEIVERRQETVHSRRSIAKHLPDTPTLEEYLYEPMDVTHPVLSDATDLLDRLRTTQHDIVLAMSDAEQS